MRFVLFYHSLVSDWNHGNAHFLRGIVSELMLAGHEVLVLEPSNGWSRENLVNEQGEAAVNAYRERYPMLRSTTYDLNTLDLDRVLEGADVVVAHEWSEPDLVRRLGMHRKQRGDYCLLFHDTHHRSVTSPREMRQYHLQHFDGVLAYGQVIRDIYLERKWHHRVWTWHEAADVRAFHPLPRGELAGDLVWIGNWGDGERTEELQEYLLRPIEELKLRARLYGVRYPQEGREAVVAAGAEYCGWIANHRVPEVYRYFRFTVHIPRRPYRQLLRGIPTIRIFEALACGIPLITSEWSDAEGLFHPGEDYLVAQDGEEMKHHIRRLLNEPQLSEQLVARGLRTINERHTCAHRVDELMRILQQLGVHATPEAVPAIELPEVALASKLPTTK